jgi:hypothetical protein
MIESNYDYESIVSEAIVSLNQLVGHVLQQFLVHIAAGSEFNVAYFILDKGAFAIHGRLGGEVLTIIPVEDVLLEKIERDTDVKPFVPSSIFLNRRIVQARSIGEAWNGHGFEFSFEGLQDKTMIVQSIYAGEKPPAFEDCLRFGIGHYVFEVGNEM